VQWLVRVRDRYDPGDRYLADQTSPNLTHDTSAVLPSDAERNEPARGIRM